MRDQKELTTTIPCRVDLASDQHVSVGVDEAGIVRVCRDTGRHYPDQVSLRDVVLGCGCGRFIFTTHFPLLVSYDGRPVAEFERDLREHASQLGAANENKKPRPRRVGRRKPGDPFKYPLGGDLRRTAGVDKNGVVRVVERSWFLYGADKEELRAIATECGYRSFEFDSISQLLLDFEGRTLEDFRAELLRRSEKNEKVRDAKRADARAWEKCRDDLGGLILCVTYVDSYDAGFTVWVSLNTAYPYRRKVDLVNKWKREIVPYVAEMLKAKKKYRKQVELLPFCRVVEMAVSRASELAIKYELRKDVQALLAADEKAEE